MPLSHNFFLTSTLPVGQNVVKNIIFKASAIVLTFVVSRLFAFLAFKKGDYISFLMFGEDLAQKAFYIMSRRFNGQALLVTAFALMTVAAGLYDTLLWALDSPGYVTKTTRMNAGQLSSQMLDSPGYLISLSNPQNNLDLINLDDTFGSNLYAPGFNFTLPGKNAPGIPATVPPVAPLSVSVPPSIWLDSDGWAVGLDNTIMFTPDMNTTETFCGPLNTPDGGQAWRCTIRNSDAFGLFDYPMGRPQIWWDLDTSEFIAPSRKDNPWQSVASGAETAMMKQIFTVTKGSRRHTFLQTTLKTVMVSHPPFLLDNAEITDFMRKTWSTSPPGSALPPAVQTLVDLVIGSKDNGTSLTFGSFFYIGNTSVTSYSTDYLINQDVVNATIVNYRSLRFASTTISLIRSEIVFNAPKPFATCDQSYSNIATGGVVRSVNCYSAYLANITDQSQGPSRFLGQIDTSSVFIMSDILGDGTQNTSDSALHPASLTWYNENADRIDQLLISRGLILGGVRADVEVDVQHNEAAVSYLQLFLTLLPILFVGLILAITFRQPMSYYTNSFFAAVCSTTHLGNIPCEKVGHIHAPPEITLKLVGAHVVLCMPSGDRLAVISKDQSPASGHLPLDEEPFLLHEESNRSTGEKPMDDVEINLPSESSLQLSKKVLGSLETGKE